ncbi:Uu.00g056170.m01.CDS01 [Anthostomella pinea]|uniref:Uu.00g056170.m01.CDS01 n=1 Tax=Anthostomella pinea TaxID=933095 RepID=A0AAI8VSL6_9PEZI|nr:Uu.00g056170.m01.CDS01 [Anthostomella pinea]
MARTKQTARGGANTSTPLCGCWFPFSRPESPHHIRRSYLPAHKIQANTIIKDLTSRTTLTQKFTNETNDNLDNIIYSFPLYDGVSVVSFTATVGSVRIEGVVKEKHEARQEYNDALARDEAAGLLEQLPEASDVFSTRIGNVAAGITVTIELVYIGELRHDAEANGTRFTIPAAIAPRYGLTPHDILSAHSLSSTSEAIHFAIDVDGVEGSQIRQLQSPSHPITVTIGRTTEMSEDEHMSHRASAALSIDDTVLDKDFIIIICATNTGAPKALLETHLTIPKQRALMATLVPNFKIPPSHGEVVFIVDRSGSMGGKIDTVVKAMTIMLKSLPLGVRFNICSFGSSHSFLWPRSQYYSVSSLEEALAHVNEFAPNFGGTEMLEPVKLTVSHRCEDTLLDAILLTDGQIWNQQELFDFVAESSKLYSARFFSLGIGSGCSTALVEGVSAAGDGFSQFVAEGERMDKKMVRLLKGALTPHIRDYSLEVKYQKDDDDYEMVESVKDAFKIGVALPLRLKRESPRKAAVSLFDKSLSHDSDDDEDVPLAERQRTMLPTPPEFAPPSMLQTPSQIPSLYPFARTTVYVLLGPSTYNLTPQSLVLRGTSEHGPLEFEIEVEDVGKSQTIHQLASRRAVHELEKGRGWLSEAKDKEDDVLLRSKYEGQWEGILQREAVRLGVQYQVASKWCSFVAVQDGREMQPVVFGGKIPRVNLGQAPRKQLASKAARKFVPTASDVRQRKVAKVGTGDAGSTQECTPASPVSHPRRSTRASVRSQSALHSQGSNAMDVDESDAQARLPETNNAKMHAIIGLQKFDGSWDWDEKLIAILDGNPGSMMSRSGRRSVKATALAVAFFQACVPEEEDAWELIVDKAKGWLSQQPRMDVDKEIAEADKRFIGYTQYGQVKDWEFTM